MAGKQGKLFKPGDYILIAVIAVSGILALVSSRFFAAEGTWVCIQAEGRPMQRIRITAADTLLIPGPAGVTRVIIGGHAVWIEEAPCPRKICRAAGKIHRAGETVICVPNRIVITVEGGPRNEIDAVTM